MNKLRLTLIVVASLGMSSCGAVSNESINRVCFTRGCIKVEVVQTDEERSKGLQFRESLKERNGMLFIFDVKGAYPFWMKDTLIPLDIIWLDNDKKVVTISKNTPPCVTPQCPQYYSTRDARYVLEINAGVAQKLGILEGDQARFK